MNRQGYFVHESAIVDDGARIGEGTRIWHFCHVSAKAEIGQKCSLGQNVYIANNVRIGDNVKIQNNVSVYEGVVLEDDVFCGPSMVFTNVKTPRSAHPRNTSRDYQSTVIKKGASLGANCTIVCGVTVGKLALVAAGAVVTQDVLPYSVVAGVPAKPIGWVCECGEMLHFHTDRTACRACQRGYMMEGARAVRRLTREENGDVPTPY